MSTIASTLYSFYTQLFARIPYPQTDFTDQVVVVTGSNRGLGFNTAKHFHRLNASKIILAVRDNDKGVAAAAKIAAANASKPADRLEVWTLDISDPKSIAAFADRAARQLLRLDAVVQNAGIKPSDWHLVNGHESTIAVNVLGASLFCLALLPLMRASAWQTGSFSRFTFVSDDALYYSKFKEWAPGGDLFGALDDEHLIDWPDRYATSKFLLLINCREIARLCPVTASSPVIIDCTTPGMCDTISSEANSAKGSYRTWTLFSRSAEVGSRSLVHAVSSTAGPDAHGALFANNTVVEVPDLCNGALAFARQAESFMQILEQLCKLMPDIDSVLYPDREKGPRETQSFRRQLIGFGSRKDSA